MVHRAFVGIFVGPFVVSGGGCSARSALDKGGDEVADEVGDEVTDEVADEVGDEVGDGIGCQMQTRT